MMHCRFGSGAEAQLNFSPVSGVIVERAVINSCDNTWFMNLPAWNAADFPGSWYTTIGAVWLQMCPEMSYLSPTCI